MNYWYISKEACNGTSHITHHTSHIALADVPNQNQVHKGWFVLVTNSSTGPMARNRDFGFRLGFVFEKRCSLRYQHLHYGIPVPVYKSYQGTGMV